MLMNNERFKILRNVLEFFLNYDIIAKRAAKFHFQHISFFFWQGSLLDKTCKFILRDIDSHILHHEGYVCILP